MSKLIWPNGLRNVSAEVDMDNVYWPQHFALVASLSFERVGFTMLLRWGYVCGFGIYVVFGFCCERRFMYGLATR